MTVAVDLYAHYDVPCGLTVSALNTERLLRSLGTPIRRHSIDERERWSDEGLDGDVNLFHINPVDFVRFLMWPHKDPGFETRINACVPFWELGRLPDFWLPVLASMDAILAPTTFIADAVSSALPDVHVIPLPQTVSVPSGVRADRSRFGLPDDAFVFGTSFAAEAVLDRKNPWATITAFKRAFPEERDVRLVVRAGPTGGADPIDVWARLQAEAQGDPRINVLRGRLDYAGILSLYATFDVYVSLHRAEGLGLGMMESMSLGTPVIATGWSGNMDFMTVQNSLPVSFEMTPVSVVPGSPYSIESIGFAGEWAEPDIEDAVSKMRRAYSDRGLVRMLSARAIEDMQTRTRIVERAAFFDDLAGLLGEGVLVDDGHAGRAAELRKIEAREQRRGIYLRPYLSTRRKVGGVLRAVGLR